MHELTDKQRRTIPYLLSTGSIEEACRRGRISKGTMYAWLKQQEFQAELRKQRETVTTAALEILKSGIEKAAGVLIELMDHPKPEIRRAVAKDIIDFGLKSLELQQLEARIAALEDVARQERQSYV